MLYQRTAEQNAPELAGGPVLTDAPIVVCMHQSLSARMARGHHHYTYADIHLRLGDVQAENGQVEEAIREYDTCIAYQDRFLPPDARPRAEVRFNKAIALSLFEKPLDALRAVQVG